MLDYVIKGGTIVDGTGADRRQGDIGVRDGVIVEVGGSITESAKQTIDADGAISPRRTRQSLFKLLIGEFG